MNFPFYIANRYLRSKSSQNAVNIINYITFFVVVVGSASLFLVLSGFSGLKEFSLSFSSRLDPDIKVVPMSGKFFTLSTELESKLAQIPGVASYSAELEERVYLSNDNKNQIAHLKGVDSLYTRVFPMDSLLYLGSWNIAQQGIVGIGLANLLGLSIDNYSNPLHILVPKPLNSSSTIGIGTLPYYEDYLTLSGIFAVELEADQEFLFCDIVFARSLLHKAAQEVSAINISLEENASLSSVINSINDLFSEVAYAKSRRELNASLYKMLNTENTVTYLIFTLVLIIALFNVVGATLMIILDKKKHLATLYAMGLDIPSLRRIYFFQGFLLSALGGIIGVLLASFLVAGQIQFSWLLITSSLPYPVAFELKNYLLVLATIFVLGALASLVASRRISKRLLEK